MHNEKYVIKIRKEEKIFFKKSSRCFVVFRENACARAKKRKRKRRKKRLESAEIRIKVAEKEREKQNVEHKHTKCITN